MNHKEVEQAMEVSEQRQKLMEALQRKHRPEMFQTEFCMKCDTHNVDPKVHVCDPVKAKEAYERQQGYLAPWDRDDYPAKQEARRQELRDKLVARGFDTILAAEVVEVLKDDITYGYEGVAWA